MNYYYTYVLLSKKDHNHYVGWTNNLVARLKEHQEGQVEATKARRPLELVYYEASLSKEKASIGKNILKQVSEEGFSRVESKLAIEAVSEPKAYYIFISCSLK